jgi:hypothetical protein
VAGPQQQSLILPPISGPTKSGPVPDF